MYYYSICRPYHTYYSKEIENYLKKSKDWKSTKNKNFAHYCDCKWNGLIKYQMPIRIHIFYKHNLAKVLINSSFHPKTFIVSRRMITDKRYYSAIRNENNNKWFLKPVKGAGGEGIKVLSKLSEWTKYATINNNYVLQKGIEGILYKNRKFDIRTYFLSVVDRKRLYLYISKESCMRISSYEYNNSNKKEVNVTNLTFQMKKVKSDIKNNMPLTSWEHYNEVFPKMKKLINNFGKVIDRFTQRIPSVALLGIDIIIDKNKEPHLIEINNAIGFSYGAVPSENPHMVNNMIKEIIEVGYLPLIQNRIPPDESNNWIKCYS